MTSRLTNDSRRRVDRRLREAIEVGMLPKTLALVGPAGTGKTFGVLRFLMWLAMRRTMRILLLRATRSSLSESVCVTLEEEILPLWGAESAARGAHRTHRHSYRLPIKGSEFVLAGLDRNIDRIKSTAWDVVFINEGTELHRDAVGMVTSRMNRPGRSSEFGYVLMDLNPGAPNHWMKQDIDAGKLAHWDTRHEANPRMHDGTGWTAEGRAYLDQLDLLPPTLRKRLRDGLWAAGEGLWFEGFDSDKHVTETAEYDPALPVYLGCDPGVFTGAVAFQVRTDNRGTRRVNVFADYLSEGRSARDNARAIQGVLVERGGKLAAGYCDPSGGARNPIGPTVLAEYATAGLHLRPWAKANPSVADSLTNVELLLVPVNGHPCLTVHPRCRHTIDAFASYRRAKRNDQWLDSPEDPQHPAEDVIDSLRGGLWPLFGGRLAMRWID